MEQFEMAYTKFGLAKPGPLGTELPALEMSALAGLFERLVAVGWLLVQKRCLTGAELWLLIYPPFCFKNLFPDIYRYWKNPYLLYKTSKIVFDIWQNTNLRVQNILENNEKGREKMPWNNGSNA